jgi:diguanylate cyclase (GGDEF)-like protein
MDNGVMVTALAAVSGAALGALVAVGATRLRRARATRRLEPVRARVDEHVAAIGETLDRVAARVAEVGARRRDELELSVDLDELLDQIVVRAAALTGAQAVAIRVQGPGDEPVVASFGTTDGVSLLETALGPPDERPFRALTINWTYGPTAADSDDSFSAALVVPVVEAGISTGALVAYAGRSSTFASEHLRALSELADEAAPQIANARRFARLGRRSLTDPLTGVRNRSGYELELEREVERAHRTGRPLSLLVLALGDEREGGDGESGSDDPAVQELASLLVRTVRTTDIPCRRRDRELAVVLPETKDDGARRLWTRLQRETGSASFAGGRTVSVGLVEWRPNETSHALDSRAAEAVGRTTVVELESADAAAARAVGFTREHRSRPVGPTAGAPAGELETRFREHLAAAVADAAARGDGLSVAAVEIDDLGAVENELGARVADELRRHVAARIDDCVEAGSVVSRLGRDRFAIVLPRATSGDAEVVLAVLQASLDVRPQGLEEGAVSISAGIAELARTDDAGTLLDRAERGLRRARAAGGGSVVVARADD